MRSVCVLVFCVSLVVSGCAARLTEMSDVEKTERLAVERGRVLEETDPVDRTRSYITISQILMDFIADAAGSQPPEELRALVDQFITAIQTARDTIVNSGRDPERRSAGYRELEISLRQQLRILDDVGRSLTIDEREPVARASQSVETIRDEILRLLFPSGPENGTSGPGR
jgi:hypothetical protein